MITLWTIAFGLVSGFAGWMLTEFLAKPFRKAVDLIVEARASLIIFGSVQARHRSSPRDVDADLVACDMPSEAEDRLKEAEKTFRDLGARLQAFAAVEGPAVWTMRVIGTDLHEAGLAFIGLSNSIGVYGKQRNDAQQRAERALRLAIGPAVVPTKHQGVSFRHVHPRRAVARRPPAPQGIDDLRGQMTD
jgi:hypothetical protein